jgi:hypothetical protein
LVYSSLTAMFALYLHVWLLHGSMSHIYIYIYIYIYIFCVCVFLRVFLLFL